MLQMTVLKRNFELSQTQMNKENIAYQSENCRICGSPFSATYHAREMMFGFKDKFEYQECGSCGCVQISELPENITKYYPPYYYSFNLKVDPLKRLPFFKRLFGPIRLKKKYKKNHYLLEQLQPDNTKINAKILDVGCGKGQLICNLFNAGFENIQGVDKFLPEEIDYGYGVKILKKELSELPSASYDLVMMHHVLEHIDKQLEALTDCHKLLKSDGCLLIRIPVIGEAWKLYKENWVQLDAPRHFFLHTLKSMQILAEKAGFEIRHTIFDSSGFQFWGSELYIKGTPLFSKENNYQPYPAEKTFSKSELASYEERAEQLNKESKGDSAAFYLYKK